MTVNKITNAPTPNEQIDKINEIIDNLNSSSVTVDSALSTTSKNPVQNKVITTSLNSKQSTISDLSTIRSGASAGATAVQPGDLAAVATSGNYNDLSNKPTIPTVNNATLTIQKNGSTVKTFTANASSNVTCNITVPTKTSDITNDSGYTSNVGTVTSVNSTQPDASGNVTISIPAVPLEGVQINGSDLTITNKKVNIPLSGTNTIGVAKANAAYGVYNNSGTLTISKATDAQVTGKSTQYRPLTPYNIDLAVKTGITTNTITLTDTEKSAAKDWLGISESGGANTDLSNLTSTGNNLVNTALNTRDNTTRLKFWTGTKAQYDAISTKDSNTLYNITDDQDITLTLLQTIYPVGSVYLSTNATCPLASLFGTWTLVSSGRALWTGTGSNGGSTIEAGLPNIEGRFEIRSMNSGGDPILARTYGSLSCETSASGETVGAGLTATSSVNKPCYKVSLDASASSSVYGNSTTVQPPAYVVNVWRRTA